MSEPPVKGIGLKRLKRKGGRVDCYWVADERLVKEGYPLKTQRLPGDPTDPDVFQQMVRTCERLQAEMFQWADDHAKRPIRAAVGTVEWLCRRFETDDDSPFRTKRAATQAFYRRYMAMIIKRIGEAEISEMSGPDVRAMHRKVKAEHGDRSAYACIQTLRRVVGYGCELRDRDAIELSRVLENVTFSAPAGRKKRATYEQVVAFRKSAHEAGKPSLALAVTLQFELGLRQKDVIGEWTSNRTKGIDGWEWGLTWAHIDGNVLRKPTSKSNGREEAEHDLSAYPDVLAELAHHRRGVGPIVLDERSGKPWSPSEFSRKFREVARKAGWPDDVWNMDSRAGAVSEAFEAGADAADVMKAATHRQMSTTMSYNRGALEQTGRVAKLRIDHRRKPRETG